MELTDDIIKYGYYVAGKLAGQRNIDHQDIAHEAFCRALRRTKPVPHQYRFNYIALVTRGVFREFYTHKTTRKRDVVLDATRGIETLHLSTAKANHEAEIVAVDLACEFFRFFDGDEANVLNGVLQGKSLRQIAKEDGRSNVRMHQILVHVRRDIREYLCAAV